MLILNNIIWNIEISYNKQNIVFHFLTGTFLNYKNCWPRGLSIYTELYSNCDCGENK